MRINFPSLLLQEKKKNYLLNILFGGPRSLSSFFRIQQIEERKHFVHVIFWWCPTDAMCDTDHLADN